MKKPDRNDPCPCGSGKKFKKCCELKMHRGRFKAEAILGDRSEQTQKTAGLASFLHPSLPEASDGHSLSKRTISPIKGEEKTKRS